MTPVPPIRRGRPLDHSARQPGPATATEATVVEGSDTAATDARASGNPPAPQPVPLLPLYAPAEAARMLAVPESWLRRRVTARLVPHTVLGKHLRFSHADLVAIATAAARPAGQAVPARRPRRGRGPRITGGW
jgi:hypothetical protein